MIVVMPMAGRGSRFQKEGISTPKPFIDVEGVPMFVRAFESVSHLRIDKLVIIALREHHEEYQLNEILDQHFKHIPVSLVLIDEVTEGQLCTVLTARHEFGDQPLLIVASDTVVENNIGEDIAALSEADGIISVADLPGDAWSFARTDATDKVVEVAEKVRISDHASTGMYYFRNASQLVEIGDAMIARDERVRGEFYIIPVYQKMIEQGMDVRISRASKMWDMGTPDALQHFLNSRKSR